MESKLSHWVEVKSNTLATYESYLRDNTLINFAYTGSVDYYV